MRVRLRLLPTGHWAVESKCWYELRWSREVAFHIDYCNGYDQAYSYALALKYPQIEEI